MIKMDIVVLEEQIEQAYGLVEIDEIIDRYFSDFQQGNDGKEKEFRSGAKRVSRSLTTKKQKIKILASVFYDTDRLDSWVNRLPKTVYHLLNGIVWKENRSWKALSSSGGFPFGKILKQGNKKPLLFKTGLLPVYC